MNFQMVETPFTLKLSIKKSPVKIYQESSHQVFNVPPPIYSPESQPRFPTDSKYPAQCDNYNEQKVEVVKLEAKNSDLESDLKCAIEKNLSLSNDLNALKIENHKLKEVAKDTKCEVKKEEKYLDASKGELETITKENKILKSDIDKKTANIINLKDENIKLKSEQNNTESELKNKRKQIKIKEKELYMN